MPINEETKQAEDLAAPPEESEAPPPPPELPLEWAYLEDGAVQDSGAADCVIEDKRLYFKCKAGPPFDIPYSEIASVNDREVNLVLTMRDGSELQLSKMARLRDMLRATLMEHWTKLNRRQALAEETLLAGFTGHARREGETPKPAGIGVYETALVLDFESGLVERIPLIFSGRPAEADYCFRFSLPGDCWTIGHLGRETGRFSQTVSQAINALEEKAQQRIRALCPAMPPFKARALVGRFLDGLAVPLSIARGAWPALEQAMISELRQAGLADSWQAVAELGDAACARIGQKAALKASEGQYRWFFVPVIRGGRAHVILEASSEGDTARATYVFRVPGGPNDVERAMDSLNYALVMVNFRREPIYMSQAQMNKPENAHYLRAMERVPALAKLRSNYAGRVAHTTPQAWRKGLQDLLDRP